MKRREGRFSCFTSATYEHNNRRLFDTLNDFCFSWNIMKKNVFKRNPFHFLNFKIYKNQIHKYFYSKFNLNWLKICQLFDRCLGSANQMVTCWQWNETLSSATTGSRRCTWPLRTRGRCTSATSGRMMPESTNVKYPASQKPANFSLCTSSVSHLHISNDFFNNLTRESADWKRKVTDLRLWVALEMTHNFAF